MHDIREHHQFGHQRQQRGDRETAIGATEGFAFVLTRAKALLEHNVRLNLVPDRPGRGWSTPRDRRWGNVTMGERMNTINILRPGRRRIPRRSSITPKLRETVLDGVFPTIGWSVDEKLDHAKQDVDHGAHPHQAREPIEKEAEVPRTTIVGRKIKADELRDKHRRNLPHRPYPRN